MLKAILIPLVAVFLMSGTGLCDDTRMMERSYSIDGNELSVNVDIDVGEYTVKRSNTSDVCRIDAEFDPDVCEVFIDFDDRKNEIEVIVDYDNITQQDDRDMAEITIELPYGPEIELRSKVKVGEINMRLGGISLREFSLRNWAGETTIDFDRPNQTTLNYFKVHCSVGETELKKSW